MSLVVAQSTESGPRIVSDTRVQFRDGRRSRIRSGVLKAVVLSSEVVVCFAGDPDIALGAIRRFSPMVGSSATASALIEALLSVAVESDGRVEFIVGTIGGDSELTRVKISGVESRLLTAWIGDYRAFEVFQRARNAPPDPRLSTLDDSIPAPARVMGVLSRAMDSAIADPDIESVGDFCVSVAAGKAGFNYMASSFIYLDRDIKVKDGDNLVAKMALPVAQGGYAVSIVEPARPGIPVLGIHYPLARLCLLFLPLLHDEAQVIHDVPAEDFVRVVQDAFGIEMTQPMFRTR